MDREHRRYDEKRDFFRMAIDCELSYSTTDGALQGIGICRNLSAGGVAFDAGEPLSKGAGIRLRIEPISRVTSPLEALAQVVRCDARHNGDGYRIAATILEIDS